MEFFLNKVNKKDNLNCWNWLACKNKNGYGRLTVNSKNIKAHRYSYFLYHPISDDIYNIKFEVSHTCDNPSCVNPNHLRLSTHEDNIKDKILRNRQTYGENHQSAKLKNKDVEQILKEYKKNKDYRHIRKELALKFNVCRQTIDRIINNKWRL